MCLIREAAFILLLTFLSFHGEENMLKAIKNNSNSFNPVINALSNMEFLKEKYLKDLLELPITPKQTE